MLGLIIGFLPINDFRGYELLWSVLVLRAVLICDTLRLFSEFLANTDCEF